MKVSLYFERFIQVGRLKTKKLCQPAEADKCNVRVDKIPTSEQLAEITAKIQSIRKDFVLHDKEPYPGNNCFYIEFGKPSLSVTFEI